MVPERRLASPSTYCARERSKRARSALRRHCGDHMDCGGKRKREGDGGQRLCEHRIRVKHNIKSTVKHQGQYRLAFIDRQTMGRGQEQTEIPHQSETSGGIWDGEGYRKIVRRYAGNIGLKLLHPRFGGLLLVHLGREDNQLCERKLIKVKTAPVQHSHTWGAAVYGTVERGYEW